jgi:hypothetical protein
MGTGYCLPGFGDVRLLEAWMEQTVESPPPRAVPSTLESAAA